MPFTILLLCLLLLLPPVAGALSVEEAAHLLRRTGFGATPAEVEALLPLGRREAVRRVLHGAPDEDCPQQPELGETTPPPAGAMRRATEQERRQRRRVLREQGLELQRWWYRKMVCTGHPLRERMTLFWHNHFTSSLQKVRFPPLLYRQNRLFRDHALGSFARLLPAVLHDPAMLIYLDNVNNRKDHPNENLARELLELFTLGQGHYRETDIRAAARALTGYSVDRRNGEFRFRGRWHDAGDKTFLGRTGPWDGDDIARILLSRPRTARFLTEKLWREFVSPTPDPESVERLAARFRDSGYELKVLLEELLLTEAFWAPSSRGTLVRSPVELLVGTARLFSLPVNVIDHFPRLGRRLGQELFNPPNVAGWPGGERWIDAQTLSLRSSLLERAVRRGMSRSSLLQWLSGRGADEPRRLLLPLPPVEPADPSEPLPQQVASLLLDPVHQLK